MVEVSAGVFWQGCPDDYPSCEPNELPIRQVYLDSYAIDSTEVTVSAYSSCVDDGGCSANGAGPGCHTLPDPQHQDHPANCVTHPQAKSYCEWAGKQLPTEAQWEKAARGSDLRWYPWGTSPKPDCDRAVMVTNGPGCGTGDTWPVGSRPSGSSPFGALDMAGNVNEWVADWYDPDYYGEGTSSNPTGPPTGSEVAVRGGSLQNGVSKSLRVNHRVPRDTEYSGLEVGFRCALDARK